MLVLSTANNSLSNAARLLESIRMICIAVPPVRQKPKPSMVWKVWDSSTTIVGWEFVSLVKAKWVFLLANNAERSGLVSHNSASPAAAGRQSRQRATRERVTITGWLATRMRKILRSAHVLAEHFSIIFIFFRELKFEAGLLIWRRPAAKLHGRPGADAIQLRASSREVF